MSYFFKNKRILLTKLFLFIGMANIFAPRRVLAPTTQLPVPGRTIRNDSEKSFQHLQTVTEELEIKFFNEDVWPGFFDSMKSLGLVVEM